MSQGKRKETPSTLSYAKCIQNLLHNLGPEKMKLLDTDGDDGLTEKSLKKISKAMRKLCKKHNVSNIKKWITLGSSATFNQIETMMFRNLVQNLNESFTEFVHICGEGSTYFENKIHGITEVESSQFDYSQTFFWKDSISIIYLPLGMKENDALFQSTLLDFCMDKKQFLVTFIPLEKNYAPAFKIAGTYNNCKSFTSLQSYTAYFYIRCKSSKRKKYQNDGDDGITSQRKLKQRCFNESVDNVLEIDGSSGDEDSSSSIKKGFIGEDINVIRQVMAEQFYLHETKDISIQWEITGSLKSGALDLVKEDTSFKICYVPHKMVCKEWISQTAIYRLNVDEWYCASVMNFFASLIKRISFYPTNMIGIAPTYVIHYENSTSDPEIDEKAWFKFIGEAKAKDRLFFPVNVKLQHWLLIVFNKSALTFEVYDSMFYKKAYDSDARVIIDILKRYLKTTFGMSEFNRTKFHQDLYRQQDSKSCGPLTLCNMIYSIFYLPHERFPEPRTLRIFFASIFLKIQFLLNSLRVENITSDKSVVKYSSSASEDLEVSTASEGGHYYGDAEASTEDDLEENNGMIFICFVH